MSQKKLLLSIFYATRSELSQHSLSPNFWRVKDVDRKEQEMRSEKWKTYGTIVITLWIYCWRKWWKIRGESWRTRGETWLRLVFKLLFYLKYPITLPPWTPTFHAFLHFCLVSAVSWDRLWFRCHNSSLGVRLRLLSFCIDSWALVSYQTGVYLIIYTPNTLKIPDQMHHCAQNWFDYFMPQRVLLHSLHLLQQ